MSVKCGWFTVIPYPRKLGSGPVMTNKHKHAKAASGDVVSRLGSRLVKIPSSVLLGGQSEVVITHGKEEYHLKVNDDGELVLTR